MKVGIPREVKNNEYRVAITPAGVHELVRHGHEVFVEQDAGVGSSITDDDYVAAGAHDPRTPPTRSGATADLLLKVKEPIAEEYHRLREDQVLFTYLHLAADRAVHRRARWTAGTTAIAYETVQLPDRSLPLLAPMSEVAGRLAPQVGAYHLMRADGGRGVLLGGVPGVHAGQGRRDRRRRRRHERGRDRARACRPRSPLLDINIDRLRQLDAIYRATLQTVASNAYELERAVPRRRPGHRRGAGPGRQGAEAGHQRAGLPDEARLGARRHRHRPGRLLRGLPADHARRPDLPGARLGLLLRRQHARRRAAHLDLRADQRHAALRRRARRPGLAGGAAPTTRRWRSGLNTHDGQLIYAPVAEAHGLEHVARRRARLSRPPSTTDVNLTYPAGPSPKVRPDVFAGCALRALLELASNVTL